MSCLGYVDRTHEFRAFGVCASVQQEHRPNSTTLPSVSPQEPVCSPSLFTQKARDLARRCTEFAQMVDLYCWEASLVSRVLCPNPYSDKNVELDGSHVFVKTEAFMSTVARRDKEKFFTDTDGNEHVETAGPLSYDKSTLQRASHLRDVMKRLREEFHDLERLAGSSASLATGRTGTTCLEAHLHGVVSCLLDTLLAVSGKFRAAESSKMAREERLCRAFHLTPLSSSAPPPVVLSDVPQLPVEPYFAFLSPQWKEVVTAASRPAAIGPPKNRSTSSFFEQRLSPAEGLRSQYTSLLGSQEKLSVNDEESVSVAYVSFLPPEIQESVTREAQQVLAIRREAVAEQLPVQQVMSTFAEVQAIMEVFSAEVVQQSELCHNINAAAEAGVTNVMAASNQLKKATERQSRR